ncbi:MAG: hypothetical protein AABN95_22365 [Acidobacteriota bacterium]
MTHTRNTDFLKLDYLFWCTEEPYYSHELIPFMQSAKLSKAEDTIHECTRKNTNDISCLFA